MLPVAPRRGIRHMPALAEAASRIASAHPANFVLGLPAGRFLHTDLPELKEFSERIPGATIQVVEGQTWDLLASCRCCARRQRNRDHRGGRPGSPMVTFYKVTLLGWGSR